jgi:hypothetical protein
LNPPPILVEGKQSTTQENLAKTQIQSHMTRTENNQERKQENMEKMLVTDEASISLCAYMDHIWII